MDKFIRFIRRPRNLYFCIIAMLTVVVGLLGVSFSYYVDDSNPETELQLPAVDTRIQSDGIIGGEVAVDAFETVDIDVYVMSNNDFETKFQLYYKASGNGSVLSEEPIRETIGDHDVYKYTLSFANFSEEPVIFKLDVASGYVDSELNYDGYPVEITQQ